jgi:hypothetical protein
MKFIPDLVGVSVIGLIILVLARFGYSSEGSALVLIVPFLLFSIVCLGIWHLDKSPISSRGWMGAAIASAIGGGFFFLIDVLNGFLFHPEMPLMQAATHVGTPFGFAVTILVCPCSTVIALVGAVRAFVAEMLEKRR